MSEVTSSSAEIGRQRFREPWPQTIAWFGFFTIVVLAWIALFFLDGYGSSALATDIGWRAILDPKIWLSICSRPTPPDSFTTAAAMWALMSLAMMLPAAVPILATFAQFPASGGRLAPVRSWMALAMGHASIWLGFALIAAVAQILLARAGLVTGHGASVSRTLSALLLAIAGFYQFSTLKAACLARCRSPMRFFIANWHSGAVGAYRMGLRHGLDCLGCCWALMLLAFVAGAMDLAWMGLAMALMIVEKLPRVGRAITTPLGIVLLMAAAFVGWNSWVG